MGAVYDISAKNPTAGPNNDGKFESLSALLSDANLNTLIPTAVRKGGMSIKFVQSSDNNYVQARCMANEFTTDITKWAICDNEVLVENPEFYYAITDLKKRLICWIRKKDGGIDWAVGVPKPIKDYVNVEVAKIWNGSTGTDIDGLNKVKAFLDGFFSSSNLMQYLNENYGKYEKNPEFDSAEVDQNGKVVSGRKKDGFKYEYAGTGTNTLKCYDFFDIEERKNIIIDCERKVVSYRDKKGILHEEAGIHLNPEGLDYFLSLMYTHKFWGSDNFWRGKKVVWIGTSVPFGAYATKSYPQEVANYLGFELVNCSVPGLAIHLNDGHILTQDGGSLTASIAEYAADGVTIPDAPIPYTPGGSYNDYYRTWEHVFTQDNADADLYVFDVVPNNTNFGLDDWNAFNKSEWRYNDDSSFASHRNTFIGALLFLMDKMYGLNPKARMIFVLGCSYQYTNGLNNFTEIANEWFIEICDLWHKINTSPKSLLQIKSLGGTNNHPSTFAHEQMGKMLVGEFLKLS